MRTKDLIIIQDAMRGIRQAEYLSDLDVLIPGGKDVAHAIACLFWIQYPDAKGRPAEDCIKFACSLRCGKKYGFDAAIDLHKMVMELES